MTAALAAKSAAGGQTQPPKAGKEEKEQQEQQPESPEEIEIIEDIKPASLQRGSAATSAASASAAAPPQTVAAAAAANPSPINLQQAVSSPSPHTYIVVLPPGSSMATGGRGDTAAARQALVQQVPLQGGSGASAAAASALGSPKRLRALAPAPPPAEATVGQEAGAGIAALPVSVTSGIGHFCRYMAVEKNKNS